MLCISSTILFSLLASEHLFLASMTSLICTTAVEIELCKSFLPNFAGTVKFVAKILMGMVPYVFLVLCMTGIV